MESNNFCLPICKINEFANVVNENFIEICKKLWADWCKLGLDYEGKMKLYEKLVEITINHTYEIVEETENKVKSMKKEISEMEIFIVDYARQLSKNVTLPKMEESVTFMQHRDYLTVIIKELKEEDESRRFQIDEVKSMEEVLINAMGIEPKMLDSDILPSESELSHLKHVYEELFHEYQKRIAIFEESRKEIMDIFVKLGLSPRTAFECLITSDTEKFPVTDENMARLSKTLQEVREEYMEVFNRILVWKEKLEKLWEDINESDEYRQNFYNRNQGINTSTEISYHLEIDRCQKVRLKVLNKICGTYLNRITELWDKCYFSESERNLLMFAEPTEETLKYMETYYDDLQKYYKKNQSIYDLIKSRQELWDQMSELEERASQPNRYKNRGGKLLQEEKERKAITKNLPEIEEQLTNMALAYENLHGKPINILGKPLIEYMKEQWENRKACRQNKLSAKKLNIEPPRSIPRKRNISGSERSTNEHGLSAKRMQRSQMFTTPRSCRSAMTTPRKGRPIANSHIATPIRTMNYNDCKKKIIPKITINGSILKNKRRSGANRSKRLSRDSARKSISKQSESSEVILAQQVTDASSVDTTLNSYNDFKERIDNKKCRSSLAKKFFDEHKLEYKEAMVEIKEAPIHGATIKVVPNKRNINLNLQSPKTKVKGLDTKNILKSPLEAKPISPTRLTRSAFKIKDDKKPNMKKHGSYNNLNRFNAYNSPMRSQTQYQIVRAKNLPPLI